MELRTVANERGVLERAFELKVGTEIVPGLLWTPEGARGSRPLVLIGHGGTQHKRVVNVLGLARRFVRHLGYAAVAIDAPGHGDRLRPEEAEEQKRTRAALQSGQGARLSPERYRVMAERATQVTGEWKAVLDALHGLPGIEQGPVGYWGVSMGTAFGVPYLSEETRVQAAVLGLAGLRTEAAKLEQQARAIQIPLLFVFQLDDELMTPEAGLALFKAFGSKQKTMHINPGPHVGTPLFERDDYETFFVRHLGKPAA